MPATGTVRFMYRKARKVGLAKKKRPGGSLVPTSFSLTVSFANTNASYILNSSSLTFFVFGPLIGASREKMVVGKAASSSLRKDNFC
jgi:hypothetical protein